MLDLVRRTFLVSVGAAALTRDKIEQFVNDSVARGELTREQGVGLVDEMSQRAEQHQQKLEAFVRSQVDKTLEMAGLVPRSEAARLEARIDTLETRLRDLSARVASSPAAESTLIITPPGVAPITVETYASPSDAPPSSTD